MSEKNVKAEKRGNKIFAIIMQNKKTYYLGCLKAIISFTDIFLIA